MRTENPPKQIWVQDGVLAAGGDPVRLRLDELLVRAPPRTQEYIYTIIKLFIIAKYEKGMNSLFLRT